MSAAFWNVPLTGLLAEVKATENGLSMEKIEGAIAFTGGIGGNSALVRKRICDGFEFLGLYLDGNKNAQVELTAYEAPQIRQANSKIRVLATQAREQRMIARETTRVAKSLMDKKHNRA